MSVVTSASAACFDIIAGLLEYFGQTGKRSSRKTSARTRRCSDGGLRRRPGVGAEAVSGVGGHRREGDAARDLNFFALRLLFRVDPEDVSGLQAELRASLAAERGKARLKVVKR